MYWNSMNVLHGLMSYLCLFAYSGVQHILCCVFALFVFCLVVSFSGLSILYCPFSFLWIVHSLLPLQFSLDCPFFIATSVFSIKRLQSERMTSCSALTPYFLSVFYSHHVQCNCSQSNCIDINNKIIIKYKLCNSIILCA